MENILYLLHTTNKYTEDWTELRQSKIEDYEDQFPGVYLTIITKENIHSVNLYPGLDNKQLLIFSKKLLEQHNYHINVRDYNGYISENNTYFPWNLNDAIRKINKSKHKHIGHEIVFHDPIPIQYMCLMIHNLSTVPNNLLLPMVPIENEFEPDTTKEPFYCYPLEKNYTGVDPFPESSRDFFVKMAMTCNVNPKLPTDEIIQEIKKNIPFLYSHRDQQKINVLKDEPCRSSKCTISGGKSKRKTIRKMHNSRKSKN
jgi:hypothetical protein